MSFSAQAKSELCRCPVGEKNTALAESCGVLLYCNTFSPEEVRVVTASLDFAQRLPKLFRRAFGVTFDQIPAENAPRHTFILSEPGKVAAVADACGYDFLRHHAHHVNFALLEDEACRQSFLRGAFLAGGSVMEPSSGYHLEFVTDHSAVSREVEALLIEMGFRPGSSSRGGRYITYFKNSGAIEDLLTTLGAPVAAMAVMSEKISKSMTNTVNRRINCDEANSDKTVAAAEKQLEAIRRLRDRGALEGLPEKLRDTAYLRLENPELSISQLAEACVPPVTKSCLSHRLRRIAALAGTDGA